MVNDNTGKDNLVHLDQLLNIPLKFLGKTHNYNTRTLRDEFNSYPPWLNVGNHKRKIKKKKTAMLKNQFNTGAVHIGV